MEPQTRNGSQRTGNVPPPQSGQSPATSQGVTSNTAAPPQESRPGSGDQPASRITPSRRSAHGELLPESTAGPYSSMLQLSREMDRLWDSFFGRAFGPPRLFSGWPFEGGQTAPGRESGAPMLWSPRIDVRQRDDAVLVHADLPGCRKEDVRLEATDEGIAISGERTQQREEGDAGKGYRFSERSHGSFYRNIPLPEGAQLEQARARMSEGVLEITIPLQQPQRRSIEIE